MVKKDKKEKKNLDVCMWLDDEPKVEEKMIYYIKADKKIEKYQVEVDQEKLKEIYKEVIGNYDNLNKVSYIIQKLLNNDASVINEIYEYEKTVENDYEKINEQIKMFSNKQKEFKKINQKAYHNALVTSDGLLFKKNIIQTEIKYVKAIKKLISFKLVDTISKKEVNDVINFLDIEKPIYGKKKIKNKMIDKHIKK